METLSLLICLGNCFARCCKSWIIQGPMASEAGEKKNFPVKIPVTMRTIVAWQHRQAG